MNPNETMNLIDPVRLTELESKEKELEEMDKVMKFLRLEIFSYRDKWQRNDPPRRDAVLRTLNRWYQKIIDLEPETLLEHYKRGRL